MKRFVACALAVLLAAPSSAAPCARPAQATASGVAQQSDAQRLSFLADTASLESQHIGTWKLVFGGVFALLVVGQLGATPLFAKETHVDYYFGAAFSALGLASTLVGTAEVYERGPHFARDARAASEENRCALIAEGERLLFEGAAAQELTGRWYVHALNVAVNVSLGLILALGYQHYGTAVLNTLVGTAISETMLLTKPKGLVSALRRYRSGEGERAVTLGFSIGPTFQGGATVGIGGRF